MEQVYHTEYMTQRVLLTQGKGGMTFWYKYGTLQKEAQGMLAQKKNTRGSITLSRGSWTWKRIVFQQSWWYLQRTTRFSGQDGVWHVGNYILTGPTSTASTPVSVSFNGVLFLHQERPQVVLSVLSASQHTHMVNGSIELFQDPPPTNPKDQNGHGEVTIIDRKLRAS